MSMAALRILAVLATLIAAGCSVPVDSHPTGVSMEPTPAAEPTKGAKESPLPTQTPRVEPTVDAPESPETPATPQLIYECAAPTVTVHDEALGPGWLFDPRAMVSFSGAAATVTVTIDGFTTQEITLTQDVEVPGLLQPIDLTRAFFDTRTDEDRYNGVSGTTRHHAVAVLTDEAGRSVTSECTFDISFA